jgi:hypothetical protein
VAWLGFLVPRATNRDDSPNFKKSQTFNKPPLLLSSNLKFDVGIESSGARGRVVVKALRYKAAGRGFDSRWCHWNFSVT